MERSELEGEIRKLLMEVELSAAGGTLSLSLLQRIALLLEKWIKTFDKSYQETMIMTLTYPPVSPVKVADLPAMVASGDPQSLKLLKVLFLS